MQKVAIGFEINDHTNEEEISLFLDSFDEFGGEISKYPLYILKPEISKVLPVDLLEKIDDYDVNLIEYPIAEDKLNMMFTDKVVASSILEERLDGEVDVLAWLSTDTLFLNEPKDFLLDEKISLGYRPVHHQLIGSSYDAPLDEFWNTCYDILSVKDEDVFPMFTCMGEKIRPYFNAGFLIVRPEKRILRSWEEYFLKNVDNKILKKFYRKDVIYLVFVHQIILSALIISMLDRDEINELPDTYNFPLNLISEIDKRDRPKRLSDLITARYDDYTDFFVKKKLYRLIDIDDRYEKLFEDIV